MSHVRGSFTIVHVNPFQVVRALHDLKVRPGDVVSTEGTSAATRYDRATGTHVPYRYTIPENPTCSNCGKPITDRAVLWLAEKQKDSELFHPLFYDGCVSPDDDDDG